MNLTEQKSGSNIKSGNYDKLNLWKRVMLFIFYKAKKNVINFLSYWIQTLKWNSIKSNSKIIAFVFFPFSRNFKDIWSYFFLYFGLNINYFLSEFLEMKFFGSFDLSFKSLNLLSPLFIKLSNSLLYRAHLFLYFNYLFTCELSFDFYPKV